MRARGDENSKAAATPPPVLSRRSPFLARSSALVLISMMMLAALTHLITSYRQETDHGRRLLSTITRALALEVDGRLRGVAGLLDEVAAAVRDTRWDDPPERQRVAGRMAGYPDLRWVGAVSPQGRLRPDTLPDIGVPPDGLDIRDRAYLRQTACNAQARLSVGQPVLGRATGTRTLHLALPVWSARRQACLGLVVAAINPDGLAALLSAALPDPEGHAAILSRAGRVIAQRPDAPAAYGGMWRDAPLLAQALVHVPEEGVLTVPDGPGRSARLLGYRLLPEYGLVVTAALPLPGLLSSWRGMALVEVPLLLALSAALYLWAHATDRRRRAVFDQQIALERAVSERTALLEASKSLAEHRAARLAQVNDKLMHLARITAHHLQEPVRPIVSFTQLARRDLLQDPGLAASPASRAVDEHLAYVERAGRRLKDILREFHRYTTLLTRAPQLRDCDLAQLIARHLAALREDLAAIGAEAAVGPLPCVRVDVEMLGQLVAELLSNAIKYRSPERPLRLSITGGSDAAGWWLGIADNGRGLPKIGRQHLFEPFSRFQSEETGAIGLGLAVCREVADMHGGSITPATLETGTRFTLRVPHPRSGE